jgi:Zn-dependent protease with chaperone function
VLLVVFAISWVIGLILSEYNVRKIQALGVTVSPRQFPKVAEALADVCQRFGLANPPRVIILGSGETNAFAVTFARKRVVLILSELLEAVLDDPRELRAVLGHEVGHTVLDHGRRGVFEMYKPARYKAARELTCDNVGLVAAGDVEGAKTVLKKLCVGKRLFSGLSEDALIDEANTIYSGLVGWFVRRHLAYPPAGTRLKNIEQFAQEL